MKSIPGLGAGRIIDLEDLQPDEDDRGPENATEQNLEQESLEMLASWDAPLPKPSYTFERDIDADTSVYYDGSTSFDEMKTSMKELEGGRVFVKILESNPEGAEIKISSTISFDRVGFLEYNPIPIESSIQDGRPTIMNLNDGPILPGLLQALLTLRQGERASILIHPALAYGPWGAPPLIPKDSYLFYSVKIYKVLEESNLSAAYRYEKERFEIIPLDEKIKIIKEQKEKAKKFLEEDQPREALIRYKAAIKWAQEEDETVKETNSEWRDLMEILYQNAAIIYNKLDMPKSASKAAKAAISINPSNVKAYFQLSKARLTVGDNSGALRAAERAHELDKQNASINNLRLQIDSIFREEKKERDAILRRMSRACV